MSVTRDIRQSYLSPRRVMRRHLDAGESEGKALFVLLSGCIIVFISQWPVAARQAFLDPSVPLEARMGATLLAWMGIAPLILYALAFITYGALRLVGGHQSSWATRMALFWALLAVGPLFLLNGLVGGFVGPGPAQTGVGLLLLGAFFYIWGGSLREAGWPSASTRNAAQMAEGDQDR